MRGSRTVSGDELRRSLGKHVDDPERESSRLPERLSLERREDRRALSFDRLGRKILCGAEEVEGAHLCMRFVAGEHELDMILVFSEAFH